MTSDLEAALREARDWIAFPGERPCGKYIVDRIDAVLSATSGARIGATVPVNGPSSSTETVYGDAASGEASGRAGEVREDYRGLGRPVRRKSSRRRHPRSQAMTATQIRIEACRLAAEAFKSPVLPGTNAANDLWCLAVFFETYIREGARGTRKDFGPKGPIKLKTAQVRKTIGATPR